MFTRTKIICTIGPATSELSTMQKMYAAGMNVVRINMSHASVDDVIKYKKHYFMGHPSLVESILVSLHFYQQDKELLLHI